MKERKQDILLMCGERIKFYRKQKGLSQGSLGEKVNMDFSQFGRIERGQTNITLSTLERIATALGVKPKDLLDSD